MDAGVDNDIIYGIITDLRFRVSDSVLDKGAEVQRYAERQIQQARQAAANVAQPPATTSVPIALQRSVQNNNHLMFNDTGFYGPLRSQVRGRGPLHPGTPLVGGF